MKNRKILLANLSSPSFEKLQGIYCQTFFCRLMGLMFKKSISKDYGLLLVDQQESKLNASVHMFFMNFDISVIWLDRNLIVVDKVVAKRGGAIYSPAVPAQYTFETSVENFNNFQPGDQIKVFYED